MEEGWGGGGKSSQLGPPPTLTLNHVWALKPPWAHGHKITYAPINLTALCIMLFMQASPILRGLGPGTLNICGPQMALA